jgi:hypothetical protein
MESWKNKLSFVDKKNNYASPYKFRIGTKENEQNRVELRELQGNIVWFFLENNSNYSYTECTSHKFFQSNKM